MWTAVPLTLFLLFALPACDGKRADPAADADDPAGSDTAAGTGGSEGDADTDADADADTDTDCDCTFYEGEANFKSGFSTDPALLDCDLYWSNQGVPTDLCDGCAWAFAIDFHYEAARSYDGVDCFGGGDTDWTWNLGFFPYYYAGEGAIYYEYAGTWYPVWLASFDGRFVQWGGGYYQYPYAYNGADYYYTRRWTGTATIE